MARVYQCPDCGKTYTVLPQDEKCDSCLSKLKPVEVGEQGSRDRKALSKRNATESKNASELMEGLCVLVCDASNSMDGIAFPIERPNLTKLELVVDAVQSAIYAMHDLSQIGNAYIAIVAFGCHAKLITDRQGKPFVKSVENILLEFGETAAMDEAKADRAEWDRPNEAEKGLRIDTASLAQYLKDQFWLDTAKVDREGTNINEALDLAFKIADGAKKGDLSEWQFHGRIRLMEHTITPVAEYGKPRFGLKNVRVLIYSDGAHNQGDKQIRNPFDTMEPISVLMTAFIGNPVGEAKVGADTMKSLATICPVHNGESYLLVNTLGRGAFLRKLYRMATRYSGFCTECAREE